MTFEEWWQKETDDNENNVDDWKGFCKSAFETGQGNVADLKANFDYILEGKDLEIKTLTDKNKQLELIILGNQEENAGLEQELQHLKDMHAEEVELHLHAEDYIKSLEQEIEKIKADLKVAMENADYLGTYSVLYNIYQDCFVEITKGVSN